MADATWLTTYLNEDLERKKQAKMAQINSESRDELQSVTYNGTTIQTRDNGRDLFRINNEVTKAKADSTYEKEWIDIDNNTVMLTNTDWIALGDAIAQQEEDVVLAARQAKDAVLAATDKASVDAVDWRAYL